MTPGLAAIRIGDDPDRGYFQPSDAPMADFRRG
jgi:hypothetical protein